LQPTQTLVLLATKQLVSVVAPAVQTPVWPRKYGVVVMQLVQTVADVQVAQGDVHATQAPPLNQYPEAQAEQVPDAMAAHGMVVAPPATTEKPRLAVTQMGAIVLTAQL